MGTSFSTNLVIVVSLILFLVLRFMVLRSIQEDIRVMIEEEDFDQAFASLKRARWYLGFGGRGYARLNADIYLEKSRLRTQEDTSPERRMERETFRLGEAIKRDKRR